MKDAFLNTASDGSYILLLPDRQVIPVGELARLSLNMTVDDPKYEGLAATYLTGEIPVTIQYCDVGETQRMVTRLFVQFGNANLESAHSKGTIRYLELYKCNSNWDFEGDPIVTTYSAKSWS